MTGKGVQLQVKCSSAFENKRVFAVSTLSDTCHCAALQSSLLLYGYYIPPSDHTKRVDIVAVFHDRGQRSKRASLCEFYGIGRKWDQRAQQITIRTFTNVCQ